MSNSEYSKLFDELYARFEAGEITAEEVCAELNKIESVIHSGPPLRNLPEELEDKWKRMEANTKAYVEAHIKSGKPLVKLECITEEWGDLTGEPDEQADY